jgi:hypothetical protein
MHPPLFPIFFSGLVGGFKVLAKTADLSPEKSASQILEI